MKSSKSLTSPNTQKSAMVHMGQYIASTHSASIPTNTFRNFCSLGMLDPFMQHVQNLAPNLYLKWKDVP